MADEPDPGHDETAAPDPTTTPTPAPREAAAREQEPLPATPAPPHPEHEAREIFQPLLYAKIAALLFVVAYSIAFVVDNRHSISVDFVFATANVSLIWTILLLLAVGLVGGTLLSQLYRHRRRQQLAKKSDSLADLGRRREAEGKPGGTPPAA